MKQIKNVVMLFGLGLQVNLMQASSVAAMQKKIVEEQANIQTIVTNYQQMSITPKKYVDTIIPAQNKLIQDYQNLVSLLSLSKAVQLTAQQAYATPAQPKGGIAISYLVEPSVQPVNASSPISTATAVGGIYVTITDIKKSQTFNFNFDSTVISQINTAAPTIWNDGLYIVTSVAQAANQKWYVSVSLTDLTGNAYATGTVQTTIKLDLVNVACNSSTVAQANPAQNSTAIVNVPIGQKILYKASGTTSAINMLTIQLDASQMSPITKTGGTPANAVIAPTTCINTNYSVSVNAPLTGINVGLTSGPGYWLVFNFDASVMSNIQTYYPTAEQDGLYIKVNVVKTGSTYTAMVYLTDSTEQIIYAQGQQVTPVNLTGMNIAFNTTAANLANPANGSTALIGVPINRTVLYKKRTTSSKASNIIVYNQPSSGQTINTSLSGSDVINKVVIKLANNTNGPDITLTSAQVAALIAAASEGSFWVNTVVQNNTLYYVFLGATTNSVIVTGSAPFNGNQIEFCFYMSNVALTEPGYVKPGQSVHVQF